MKLFATKTLFGLLTISLLTLFCIGLGYAETPVPEGHLRITIINDTDILMFHCTYWLNHNIPGHYGPDMKCCAELEPGADQTFDMEISEENFVGTRLYGTVWSACKDYRNELEEYKSKVISTIPKDTAIVKIYHKHFETIPK